MTFTYKFCLITPLREFDTLVRYHLLQIPCAEITIFCSKRKMRLELPLSYWMANSVFIGNSIKQFPSKSFCLKMKSIYFQTEIIIYLFMMKMSSTNNTKAGLVVFMLLLYNCTARYRRRSKLSLCN